MTVFDTITIILRNIGGSRKAAGETEEYTSD